MAVAQARRLGATLLGDVQELEIAPGLDVEALTDTLLKSAGR